jgi:hypothetical protein
VRNAREIELDLGVAIFERTAFFVFCKIITKNMRRLNKVTLIGNLGKDRCGGPS